MIDILFVHSNASLEIYQGLAQRHSAIEPPIWAAMLANAVRARGHSTQILDAEAERIDYLRAAARIGEYKARIVCFVVYGQQPSASTQNMAGACATAHEFRKLHPDAFIMFVGGHVAALPEETLQREACIDAVCQNEGVYTICDLLQVADLGDEAQLANVKGFCWRGTDGRVRTNAPSAIVARADMERDLPGMAWDLLPPLGRYRTAGWHSWSNDSVKEPFAALYTSLGCPYRCSFCMINIINRTKPGLEITSADSNLLRTWSPEFVIRQFEHIAAQGVRNVKIADELFVLNPNHFERICKLIRERGYDFNIWAYSRVDTCKPRHLESLRRAGVRWLGLGIENPNETLRREIHKDGYHDVRIVDLIRMIRDADICVGGNYIFGLPDDTEASMQDTLEFALANQTDMVNFYCAMAYPGSPLHLQARKQGIALPQTYSGYSQHSYDMLCMSNAHLAAEQIVRFRDYAWTAYNSNESYLSMLEKKFGRPARKDLEDTLKVRLKRKLMGDQP